MIEAPKRIWAFHDGPMVGYFVGQSPGEGANVSEYIRADLVDAAIKRALEGAAEAKLEMAVFLLTDAMVQLREGKIKTRRNRADIIGQVLTEWRTE